MTDYEKFFAFELYPELLRYGEESELEVTGMIGREGEDWFPRLQSQGYIGPWERAAGVGLQPFLVKWSPDSHRRWRGLIRREILRRSHSYPWGFCPREFALIIKRKITGRYLREAERRLEILVRELIRRGAIQRVPDRVFVTQGESLTGPGPLDWVYNCTELQYAQFKSLLQIDDVD